MTADAMPLDATRAAAVEIRREHAGDRAAVDALFDAAFGPGRFAKTAERVRERTREAPDLCVVAREGERIVGAARQHHVTIGGRPGAFLGPFAVAADRRGLRIGPRMIEAAADAAKTEGLEFLLLVGSHSYFGPLGFEPVAPSSVDLGGPVDPKRLLWMPLQDRTPPTGVVTA